MTRLMLILSAIAALMLIAAPAAQACPDCGCEKAKAEKTSKAKDCPANCDCKDCKAKDCPANCDCKDCKAKKDKACPPGCDCAACKAKAKKGEKAQAGCDCAKKGSHPECPYAKGKKK